MPTCSMCANSALATDSFSGLRRLALAWRGGPLVSMWCSTPCFTVGAEKVGLVRSGNSASSRRYWSLSASVLDNPL